MSLLNSLNADKSAEGEELRKSVKQALVFGFAGIGMLIGLHFFPPQNHFVGLVPGMSLGLMAAYMGMAFKNYKETKKDK